jgi:hypothetical protein
MNQVLTDNWLDSMVSCIQWENGLVDFPRSWVYFALLKQLYYTCALRVSRGLSILGKAIRGTPRGSSGLGLEGDPCVPLKL